MTDKLKILICDDEMGMRMGVARALRDFVVTAPELDGEVSFDVDQAETGEQALEKITAEPPHILLLDLKLPGMSGLDVLEEISPRNLETLTVMITAYASIETAVRATKTGAYDFLAKPFTPAELKNTVTKAAKHLLISRQARLLAQEKRQIRFQFISVLAHELKAPINAVEGYLNILRDGTAGDNPAVQAQIIERCGKRISGMRKMITDLLDLTRIESGQKKRELAQVDVREIAEMALETLLPDAQARDITMELHTDGSLSLLGDPGEIEIILNNFVSNAVKYNRDGGRVDVRLSRDDNGLYIAVTDTGIGMSKVECDKLFGDFVRIKNAKTSGILGSGLGLSIVKKLAGLYGGVPSVTSTPDEGSTFSVVLQNAVPEDEPEDDSASPTPQDA
jgi:two-component system, sensor histidine kinase and response regulator